MSIGTESPRSRPRFAAPGWLAVGDLLVIGLFVLSGEFQHYPPDVALSRAPETALPFVLGWALVGTAVGAYASDALAGWRTAMTRTALGWAGGAVIGLGLRATSFLHGGVTPAFAAVAIIVGGTMLVVWRGLATAAQRRV